MRLTKKKVEKIKAAIADGVTQPAIAMRFGISRSLVSDIATGRVHRDVAWPGGEPPTPKRAGGQRRPVPDYDPTDKRVLELEAEVLHLTEERNRERQKVKAGAKIVGLFKAVVAEMEQRVKPFAALPTIYQPRPKAQIVEHCVLHLSDCHHDAVVRPEEVGGLEEHNFPISCARAERLVDTVIDWSQDTLAPKFHFPVLWVLAYGDFTGGEIHGAAERSYYRNTFRNCLAIGQLHALMLRDFAPHFEHVNVLYLSGNHGRRTPKKEFAGAHNNFDYLVAEIARLHCRGIENISFQIPDAWSANVNINGIGFNIAHGDDVRGNLSIPFYGMVRRQKGLVALGAAAGTQRCRYFVMGHHHVASTLSDIDGELLVNGAWVGTDAYSYNSLSGYREPAQWFHGVTPKYGISWRLNVKLRHEGEKKGPKRYLIDGGREVGPLR
jgi:hypothetical protein